VFLRGHLRVVRFAAVSRRPSRISVHLRFPLKPVARGRIEGQGERLCKQNVQFFGTRRLAIQDGK
jgi:hypothetical protein